MGTRLVIWVIAVCTNIIQGCLGYDYCGGLSYCEDGYYCCDSNTRCCSNLTVGAIIGIVIGCIVFIICVIAVICIIVNKKKHQGMIVQPYQPVGNVTVVSTGQTSQLNEQQPYGQSYGYPAYGQPPPYPPQGVQPDKSGPNQPGQDVAYPPPPQPATY